MQLHNNIDNFQPIKQCLANNLFPCFLPTLSKIQL